LKAGRLRSANTGNISFYLASTHLATPILPWQKYYHKQPEHCLTTSYTENMSWYLLTKNNL